MKEDIDNALTELERLDWMIRSLTYDIQRGDVISAGVGITAAQDKVTEIRELVKDMKG